MEKIRFQTIEFKGVSFAQFFSWLEILARNMSLMLISFLTLFLSVFKDLFLTYPLGTRPEDGTVATWRCRQIGVTIQGYQSFLNRGVLHSVCQVWRDSGFIETILEVNTTHDFSMEICA